MNADESLQLQLLLRGFDCVEVSRGGKFVPITPAEEKELIWRLIFLECDSMPFASSDFC